MKFTHIYSVEDLVAELQRVGELVGPGPLTHAQFSARSSISTRTFVRRFGSWESALQAAGLHNRYTDRAVTEEMRAQRSHSHTNREILAELRRVAELVQPRCLTEHDLGRLSPLSYGTVRTRFGSWRTALQEAGLPVSRQGQFFTDDELAANLSTLLDRYQRLPTVRELNRPPSTATYWTYRNRFGTLTQARDRLLPAAAGNNHQPSL